MIKEPVNPAVESGFFGLFVNLIRGTFYPEKKMAVQMGEKDCSKEFVLISTDESYHKLVDILVDEKVSCSEYDKGVEFLQAVTNDDIGKVRMLLANGIDPNFSDEMGNRAILEAVRESNTQMIELLLAYKVDLAVKSNDGCSISSYLRQNQNYELYKLLKTHGFSHSGTIKQHTIRTKNDSRVVDDTDLDLRTETAFTK